MFGYSVLPALAASHTYGFPNSGTKAAGRAISSLPSVVSSDLEDELRSAADDFERGDYIELSAEQLERCIATGESPWPDESRG
jgi:hypothetical protein